MTHEWKPGDRAMVIVDRQVSSRSVDLRVPNELPASVWLSALRPLPAPDPHQFLKDAVVEAVGKWMSGETAAPLQAAWRDLEYARTPPDPVEELRDAWDGLCNHMSGTETAKQQIDRVSRAIAALEAARKVGK